MDILQFAEEILEIKIENPYVRQLLSAYANSPKSATSIPMCPRQNKYFIYNKYIKDIVNGREYGH